MNGTRAISREAKIGINNTILEMIITWHRPRNKTRIQLLNSEEFHLSCASIFIVITWNDERRGRVESNDRRGRRRRGGKERRGSGRGNSIVQERRNITEKLTINLESGNAFTSINAIAAIRVIVVIIFTLDYYKPYFSSTIGLCIHNCSLVRKETE